MLPFDPKHLPPVRTPSLGVPSGFGENFAASMELQRKVESQRAVPMALGRRWTENLERARELSGEEFDFAPLVDQQWQQILEAQREGREWEGSFVRLGERSAAQQFNEVSKRLAELKRQHPEIKTFEEIRQEIVEEFRAQRGEGEEVYGRADWLGVLGSWTGSMVGSFDPTSDPLNFLSLFAPAPGINAFRRILAEAVIGAGTETAVQFGSVQERQRLLGVEPINPWASIAFAGAGAAAFRGIAFEGAPAAFRAGERLIDPQRARAREFASAMDETLRLPADRAPTREELLVAARRAPQTPEVRAATYQFELDTMTLRDIPDQSPEGFRQWRAEVEDAVRTVEGMGPAQARVDVEPEPTARAPLSESDRSRLRREQPEVAKELDDLNTRIGEIEEQIETPKFEVEKHGPSVYRTRTEDSDQFGQVRKTGSKKWAAEVRDRETGDLKRMAGVWPTRKDALEEVQGIIARESQSRRKQRLEPELRVLAERKAQAQQLVERPEPAEPRPPLASEVAVNARVKAVAEVESYSKIAEAMDEQAEAWFERAQTARGETTAEGEAPPVRSEAEPTSVDIGTDRPIDLDQVIDFRDENGLVVQRTARELLDDMADEDAMFKASKECLI